jgi:DNA-binding response OmpR family regulator
LKEEIEITRFSEENTIENKRKLKLLVVEDNEELRHFVSDSFIGEFNVLMAKDGEEGLKIVKEELPDIVISDVMMPKMDGLEFCKAIKSNIEISHIPVILLTAKNSDESKISGSEVGADSYITKPFSLKLLQLTVNNILESRKRLKEMYAHDNFVEAREMGTTKRDKEFIDYLISIVEEHLDDTNLDVDMICNQVGMSRTKLYNKIQSLTGQPVGEFIRKLRLKKAAQIIVSEDVSITEVMEKVGIQSQSYFTKAFKKEFGKTPTKFLHDYIVEKEMLKV